MPWSGVISISVPTSCGSSIGTSSDILVVVIKGVFLLKVREREKKKICKKPVKTIFKNEGKL
jgi:hypothetical protein